MVQPLLGYAEAHDHPQHRIIELAPYIHLEDCSHKVARHHVERNKNDHQAYEQLAHLRLMVLTFRTSFSFIVFLTTRLGAAGLGVGVGLGAAVRVVALGAFGAGLGADVLTLGIYYIVR